MAKARRITRVTTRSGDFGMTSRGRTGRVPKNHPAICALGDLDELNSAIGWARATGLPDAFDHCLATIQNDLFIVGADVLAPLDQDAPRVTPEMVTRLEEWIQEKNAQLPALTEFVLPGGTEPGARLHLVRAICRRAERTIAHLLAREKHSQFVLPYMNRLSDLLFVMARFANQVGKAKETEAHFSRRHGRATI
ncbi:MAG: cob(I)yrinic acid a,c-diamide adenosyltransferase [bacterium JZ-2024 1]